MSNATVSNPGLRSNYVSGVASTGTDANELYLELFGGEVLNAFNQAQVTANRHKVRTIAHGKSASFPATWKSEAAVHTAGSEITGNAIKHAERVITIDDMLVASVFVDKLDDALVHWDIRKEYSTQVGEILANTMDQHVLQCMTIAARTPATVQGGDGGSVLGVNSGGVTANYELLIDAIFASLREMDDKNVPAGGRQVFLRPISYYALMRDPTVGASSNYFQQHSPIANVMSRDVGGSGSIESGSMPQIGGAEIVKTNNLITADISSALVASYNVNQSQTVALVNEASCVGTVKLVGLSIESSYDPRRLGNLLTGSYAVGHGILRPECAVEITDASGELEPAKSTDGNRP